MQYDRDLVCITCLNDKIFNNHYKNINDSTEQDCVINLFKSTITTVSVLMFSLFAMAEEQPNDNKSDKNIKDEDNVINITARNQEESLQEYTGGANAISVDDFAADMITNLADIRDLVPNLYLEQGLGGGSTPKMFVRGIVMDNPDMSFDSPVGIYVDGVYIARAFGALTDLYDEEKVEFLRGPQGSLYGRNNSAGALRIITKKPELDKFDMGFNIGFGNKSQINSDLFINKDPVNDSV